MKIVRCLLDQGIFIWCLNYCSVSNNIVVRAVGSIAWPLRSRLGQLPLPWWITEGGLRQVPDLPFLQGDLIKETLQLDSFYQNVWLFKCQQLRINCETGCSWEELWQWLSPRLFGLLAFSSKWCHGNWWMGAWGASCHKHSEKWCLHPCEPDPLGGRELNLATSGGLLWFQSVVPVSDQHSGLGPAEWPWKSAFWSG